MKKNIFIVIDGNALLHRAWHAIPPLTSPDGIVVNALYGFVNILERLLKEFDPKYVAVAWDLPGKTFRHLQFEQYKATRKKKEPELYAQIPIICSVLDAYGVPSVSAEGFEADDVIGTIAKKYSKDANVLIVTGDMDALQLVDKNVQVVSFVKGVSEIKIYDEEAVIQRYSLKPSQIIDLKTLMGDASDNIPGVQGIGKKGATDLLNEHGNVDGLVRAIKSGKLNSRYQKKLDGKEGVIKQMKELVTIVTDVPLKKFDLNDALLHRPDKKKLVALFEQFGFKRLILKYKEKDALVAVDTSFKQVSLDGISKTCVFIAMKSGPQSLFDSPIKELSLFDGSGYHCVSHPSMNDISNILDVLNSSKLVVGHELKTLMHSIGEIKSRVFDTKVAAYLLSSGTRDFDLENIVHKYLGKEILESDDISIEVSSLHSLYYVLEKSLNKEGMNRLVNEIEMPLIRILYKMEKTGVLIDSKKLKEMSGMFTEKLNKITKQIYKLTKSEFNINSPSQLADVLFEKLKISTKGIKKNKNWLFNSGIRT
ncbi:hypothetical protein KJ766_02260 [Patescibacteria group bacterium]|nr:hypothetical protein [Patescibacteria group bacterium]